MSVTTWREEFYPVPAIQATDPVAHSLQKWRGLTKENLAKHGCEIRNGDVVGTRQAGEPDVEYVQIDGSTCALCEASRDEYGDVDCQDCPLASAGYECGEEHSPWEIWCEDCNPQPMIDALASLQEAK